MLQFIERNKEIMLNLYKTPWSVFFLSMLSSSRFLTIRRTIKRSTTRATKHTFTLRDESNEERFREINLLLLKQDGSNFYVLPE